MAKTAMVLYDHLHSWDMRVIKQRRNNASALETMLHLVLVIQDISRTIYGGRVTITKK